jgi:hypothetical protein
MPSGYCRDGVVYTSRGGLPWRLWPAAMSSPCSSTGSGTISASAARSTSIAAR